MTEATNEYVHSAENYRKMVATTESKPEVVSMGGEALKAFLEVGFFAGELLDAVKKIAFYDRPLTDEEVQERCIDLTHSVTKLSRIIEEGKLRADTVNAEDGTPEKLSLSAGLTCFNKDNMTQDQIRLMHCGVGIFTEGGELLKPFIDFLSTGELDMVNFGEELGDADWYIEVGSDASGVSEEARRRINGEKLFKRYAGGKFSNAQANARDLPAEREILEGQFADTQPQGAA